LPLAYVDNLQSWRQDQFSENLNIPSKLESKPEKVSQTVWVLCDLYSQYQEPKVGQATLSCLQKLGLDVQPLFMQSSPRVLISKGLLVEAKEALLEILLPLKSIKKGDLVVGIEPSELLVWRDEVNALLKASILESDQAWLNQKQPVLSFEELILTLNAENKLPILDELLQRSATAQNVLLHVHCHQKALATPMDSKKALELIPGVTVEMLPTGCCGMSGEFGYKHYDVSKKIAEQTLLPRLAQAKENDLIVATGTSCRHQIEDLGNQSALHIAQVFDAALR
jgi:Fe-S oxidoreductase